MYEADFIDEKDVDVEEDAEELEDLGEGAEEEAPAEETEETA